MKIEKLSQYQSTFCTKIFMYWIIQKNTRNCTFFQKKSKKWKAIFFEKKIIQGFFKLTRRFNIFLFSKIKNISIPIKKKTFFFQIFFLFLGFFSATSAITIIGSVADWDPLAAAVMLCWVEYFSYKFYFSNFESFGFKMINGFKVGINFGMFVDALKLTS